MNKVKYTNARANLRAHFLENTGRILLLEELQKVAGINNCISIMHELRDKEGYQIQTDRDRNDLMPNEYLLDTQKPYPTFEKNISEDIRTYVLENDDFTCYMCGSMSGDIDIYDATKSTRLHIGHIIDKSMGGTDDPNNLRAICSVCNEGASNLTLNRPDAIKLIAQVRRAPAKDQLDVLKWLIQKFPAQTEELFREQS
jgi:5-methylcytosine-specific restriction endonuclease McrA